MLWKFQKRRKKIETFTLPLVGSSGVGPHVTTFRFWSNSMEYAKFAHSKCSLMHSHMSYVPLSSILECFLDCALEHATTLCIPACTGHEKTFFNAYSIYVFFVRMCSIIWVMCRQLVLISTVVLFRWRNLKYVSCCGLAEYWSVEYVFVLLQFGFVYCPGI